MARDAHQPRQDPANLRGDLVTPEQAEQLDVANDRRTALATMILGAVLFVVAVVVVVQAARLDNGDETVGPATAPWVVGVLLGATAILLVIRGRRDMGFWEYEPHAERQDWLRLLAMIGILVAFAVIMPWLGYVLSATLLFGATAILLGAPHRAVSFAYGFCVAAIVFLLFDVLIGISLPAGPWGF